MTVYTMLCDGFEEVEALAVVDLLRRAGIAVEMVSVEENETVTGSHQITVTADAKLSEIFVDAEDTIFLPGGQPGTTNLAASETLCALLKNHVQENGRLAAICAAPTVLGGLGLLEGKHATCYGGLEDKLIGAIIEKTPVVTDGQITTSRGMGTAVNLGLELIRILVSADEAYKLAKGIMLPSAF